MNTSDYLARFNAEFHGVSLQDLAALQILHMRHVPFENLDVIRKVPIYLNLQRIYEKIVLKKRGGYCYEVNGLFHWLLEQLGYQANLVAATVKRPTGKWAKADTHAAILVQLEQLYIVDVGFGDSSHQPVPLNGETVSDVSGTYRIKEADASFFDMQRKEESGWRTLYRFHPEQKNLVDFHEGCVFNQVSKDSSFTHHDLATKATADGRITLKDCTWTVTKNGVREERNVTEEEKRHILKSEFGIVIE